MIKQISLLVCLGAAMAAQAQSADGLKIYYGARDTVTTATINVVAITEPKSTATINGESVKVYPLTGSFGRSVDLQPGDNNITIKVTTPTGRVIDRTWNVFRAEAPAKTPAAPEAPTVLYESPRYVLTASDAAYLQYGNGDDRLGGSKMGFLDGDIPLKVVGEKGSLYKVQLTPTRVAYVPKEHTKAMTTDAWPAAPVNTGSWSITNAGESDRIVVRLPVRLPYHSFTELEPSTICVDLFGATDNSNWMTQRGELGIVDYATMRQEAGDVYRVILRLKDKQCWGYSVHYEGNNLVIDVRHRPKSLVLKDLVIGLDAGHGGQYPGAISPSGLKEKDVNLDIILNLRDMLEKAGAKVVLTREGDTGPSMAERKQIWRDAKVDIAISVHNNSSGNPFTASGTSTYYKHLFDRCLAQMLLNRMLDLGLDNYGLTGNFNFSLNGPTEFPNALVEGLFMSNLEEEAKLASPEFRKQMARQIFLGLQDFLKWAQK